MTTTFRRLTVEGGIHRLADAGVLGVVRFVKTIRQRGGRWSKIRAVGRIFDPSSTRRSRVFGSIFDPFFSKRPKSPLFLGTFAPGGARAIPARTVFWGFFPKNGLLAGFRRLACKAGGRKGTNSLRKSERAELVG